MCGIAGIVDLRGREVDPDITRRMCDRLRHRGPDAEGYHHGPGITLGHRRLSIIDLSGGKQPMSNEDGSVWVTFNGEIYNFAQLRAALEKRGHRFTSHSDTEVIVHSYEEYGEKCVEHFRGMFAFAIWDAKQRRLFLARDRLGKKPLFYALVNDQFIFASELQGLVAHPNVSKRVDRIALDDYLTYGYIPPPRTIFQDIFKLPPAHTLSLSIHSDLSTTKSEVKRYWQLTYEPKNELSESDAVQSLGDVLTEAVRLRMIADVPLGALLSGGVDSSVVVAIMSGLSSRPVKTFSIGFEERAFNELPYARLVAERYKTEHHELIVRPNAMEVLPTLVRHYGEPFADSSAVPSYYVAQMTRQHVTVALNGDGGDECFGGYDRYFGTLLAEKYQRLPRLVRRGLIEPAAALIPNSLPRRNRLRQAKRFLEVASSSIADRYLRWVTYFTPKQKQELYTSGFHTDLSGHVADDWMRQLFADKADGDQLDRVLAVDVASYLPHDLLVKMDIATMAHSLEARSPFLDHEVMEFAARLPANLKVRGKTLKYVLRKYAEKLLPPAALNRRKMGFGVPVGEWMRGDMRPLLEETLLSDRAIRRGYFQLDAVRRLIGEHVEGRQDHASRLWSLLWLELWHCEFID